MTKNATVFNPLSELYPDSDALRAVRACSTSIGINYVYFILDKGVKRTGIKIGQSWNPSTRMKQLERRVHRTLKLLAVIADPQMVWERRLHKAFSDARLTGEWFLPCSDLVMFIQWLRSRSEGADG